MSGTNPDGSHYNDPGHPLDQLLQRRRRDPRVPARLLRDAAEPRLRRAAARGGGEGLAVHADRDARHDRELRRARRGAPARDDYSAGAFIAITLKTAPCGSRSTAARPIGMSNGGTIVLPPADSAAARSRRRR